MGSVITGPLFLLGGMKLVMSTAAAIAVVGFFVVLSCPEPQKVIVKGDFRWSDVRAVLVTREWRYIASSYLAMGLFIGFAMLFINVLLVDKYDLQPSEISLLLVPVLTASLVASVFIGPHHPIHPLLILRTPPKELSTAHDTMES